MNPFGMKGRQAYAFWTVFSAVVIIACYNFVDLPLAKWVHPYHGTAMYGLAKRLTKLGDATWYVVPALIVALGARRRAPVWASKAWYLLATLAAGGLAVTLLKAAFGRSRPGEFFDHNLYGFYFMENDNPYFSFPSGHTTVFFCVWMSFAVLWPRWRYAFFTLAFALSFTRVLVEAHYLSDVVGGALLGTCSAYLVASFWRHPLHLPEPVAALERQPELEPQAETA